MDRVGAGRAEDVPDVEVVDEETAARLAELFSALSDSSRVRILSVLAQGEMHVGALAHAVGISESAVSHHLRGLRQMRLVRARKEGRFVFYTLDDDHIADLFRCGLDHVRHG
ncbi:MAG: metalloregulator ArsR/SmtB family transcription factor [Ardenticatenia bacterium]|nr:metalloregulator ArsR/SmtB family transcription factor [Ardenticatenia bacterium]